MVSVVADSATTLTLLIDRLSWPVKLVRWRAAKAIKSLIEQESTRQAATAALLHWIAKRRFESEVVSGLSVFLVTLPEARPNFETACANIGKPSILSDLIIERMYEGRHCGGWDIGHSGAPPTSFVPSAYFEEHKAAQIPAIFSLKVQDLEECYGFPFRAQWAYEWECLTDQTNTVKTGYSNYFGDYGLQRSGVIGQFVQRQSEVYRSAYLRMLAYAVFAWGMPARAAAKHVLVAMSVLPDLFEVEPQQRPQWLGNVPAQCLQETPDLDAIGRRILKASKNAKDTMVAVYTPFPAKLAEFGELTMSAFFVTEDFIPFEGQVLGPINTFIFPDSFGFDTTLQVPDLEFIEGQKGNAISVCSLSLIALHGFWHDDYSHRGFLLPAPYCFENQISQRAEVDGLKLFLAGVEIAKTTFWHDAWTPLHSKDCSTRCGLLTTMKTDILVAAAKRLGRKVGWSVKVVVLEKGDYISDRAQTIRTSFFM